MPSPVRHALTLIQIISLIGLALAGWFLLDHWTYVAACSFGVLLATLYIELYYERSLKQDVAD